jgi:hypothetical protein
VKQIGRWTLLPTTEHNWLAESHKRLCEDLAFQYDIGNYLRNQLQDLGQANHLLEDRRRLERKAAFTAGKFHAAGGYAHALMLVRKELHSARLRLATWRPFVEALETTPGQLTDINEASDDDAVLDFLRVGVEVERERRQA